MSESTSTVAPPSSPAPAPARVQPSSFWEDVIDIFYAPSAVFRRRENRSVWPPMLFVAIAMAVIAIGTFNTLQPVFDAEFTRNAAKAMAKNPQVTQEMMDKGRDYVEAFGRYGVGVVMLVTMFVLGVVAWLVGKLVGSRQTFHAALVVAAWSYMPRVLGAVLGGVQGLLMDPQSLTGQQAISLGPARFLDPDTANPLLLQLLLRLDVITLWVTLLLAVGLYVTGKVSKQSALAFGILMWIVGSLPALRAAYMAM